MESAKSLVDISFVKDVISNLTKDKDEDVRNTAINVLEIVEQRKK